MAIRSPLLACARASVQPAQLAVRGYPLRDHLLDLRRTPSSPSAAGRRRREADRPGRRRRAASRGRCRWWPASTAVRRSPARDSAAPRAQIIGYPSPLGQSWGSLGAVGALVRGPERRPAAKRTATTGRRRRAQMPVTGEIPPTERRRNRTLPTTGLPPPAVFEDHAFGLGFGQFAAILLNPDQAGQRHVCRVWDTFWDT